jgi:class 3 adenylate cyclase/predicted ATPase
MDFFAVVDQVIELLRSRGRVSYRALKRQFALDDAYLDDLKAEIIEVQQLAVDQDGTMLVWTGDGGALQEPSQPQIVDAQQPDRRAEPRAPAAERRQLTVMFCDLVDSTRLAGQLDPEDLREVVLAYQATCVEVLQRFDGHVAQYLGDGLLVYFGYPQAHEDDAQRAVRTGLSILDAMGTLNTRLEAAKGRRLAVRIGIHTGPVVVGIMGSGNRHEQLALGETPNLTARLQSFAAPDTVAISETTHWLVQGYFRCDDLGSPSLKGVETPLRVYRVVAESAAQSRLDVAGATGLTPLVGREPEVGLLQERWAQSKEGRGQVVLLSGEAGIGKSRLVRVLTEWVVDAEAPHLTLRCFPFHTNSAFYPVIDHLQRLLQWQRHETPEARLASLEQALRTAGLPLEEVVPLLAALLALPIPERYPPLTLSPKRQKQKTQEALVAWLVAEATQQPVLAVWEDLHWADPSTLELLALLLDQVPTTRLLLVLTSRPEFRPPWAPRSYVTPLTLTRLPRHQSEEMVLRVTGGKPLPAEVLAQIVVKTDGIPLFVEELVKTILEAGLVQEDAGRYVLTGPLPPLAIPATLQDALMARLDRLAVVKEVAQLGAVLGREFAYALLQAVAPLDEATLQHGLTRLVEAELLYQRGILPQATYLFKHALVQDTAYQSLLRSTRQQYHQRIAQVLEAEFAETVETQPEVLAHHYTEASLPAQAIPYWQRAGERALQRSANLEAVSHVTRGLEGLAALPETRERAYQELALQLTLGPAMAATKGQQAPETARTYARACELARQVGDTPHLFPALWGFWYAQMAGGKLPWAWELGKEFLGLAQQRQDPLLLVEGHRMLGNTAYWQGELAQAKVHVQAALTLYDPEQHRAHAVRYGSDSGVICGVLEALTLWMLGYPGQAWQDMKETLALARRLAHPFSLAQALHFSALLHQLRREPQAARAQAEAELALCTEQDITHYHAWGLLPWGWALAEQGQVAEGIAQIRQGFAGWRATGAGTVWPLFLVVLAEACGKGGQNDEGLRALEEALEAVQTKEERLYEAEVYRLKGELLLQRSAAQQEEAVACFQQALAVARRQQAKSWELRAAVSLSRLWQRQGKQANARELLAPIYSWFTEGFDTADLHEAKALLEKLS